MAIADPRPALFTQGARPRRRSRSSGRARTWRCRSSRTCAALSSARCGYQGDGARARQARRSPPVPGAFRISLRSASKEIERRIALAEQATGNLRESGAFSACSRSLRSSGSDARVLSSERSQHAPRRAPEVAPLRRMLNPRSGGLLLEAPRSAALARPAPERCGSQRRCAPPRR